MYSSCYFATVPLKLKASFSCVSSVLLFKCHGAFSVPHILEADSVPDASWQFKGDDVLLLAFSKCKGKNWDGVWVNGQKHDLPVDAAQLLSSESNF